MSYQGSLLTLLLGCTSYLSWLLGLSLRMSFSFLSLSLVILPFLFVFRLFNKENLKFLGRLSLITIGVLLLVLIGPELIHGEKMMDQSLLNYFQRLESFPIEDPWSSGTELNYYYFGYFIWGMLGKLLFIKGTNLYLLSLSLTFSLFIYQVFEYLKNEGKKGGELIVGALLIFFSGNIAGLLELFGEGGLSISSFWGMTRVYENGFFSEFPLWSFMWKDLHPHFIALPFIMSTLSLWKKLEVEEKSYTNSAFFSLSFLLLTAINSWDGIFLIFYISLSSLFHLFKNQREKVLPLIFFSILSSLLFLPYLLNLSSGKPFVMEFEYSGFLMKGVFLMFGGWLLLMLLNLKQMRPRMAYSVILLFIFQQIIVMDKINTIFKFNTTLWWVMGLTLVSLIDLNQLRNKVLAGILCCSGMVVVLSSYNPKANLVRWNTGVINWIQSNEKGTPVLLEASGTPYDYTTSSISSLTGLPTILGWGKHQLQRGKTWEQIVQRKIDLRNIYESTDSILVYELLKKYAVKLIIVGPKERVQYKRIRDFSSLKAFKEVYSDKGVSLYRYETD